MANWSARCCCSFIMVMVLFFFAMFLFWIIVNPTAPKVHVRSVSVTGLSTFNSSVPLNTSVTYEIDFRNGNRMVTLHYQRVSINFQVHGVTIAYGSIPSFAQGKKTTDVLTGLAGALDVPLDSDGVALLTNRPTDLPLYVEVAFSSRITLHGTYLDRMSSKARCNLDVDLTRLTGSQITSNHCHTDWWTCTEN